jgi:metal-responsive CopG/Arc/MetJ family transcriptional regulator
MTLTVRLDPALERKLEAACKRRHSSKSKVVTDLIEEFVAREPEASSYQIAAKLGVIGSDTTAATDVAANAKTILRRVLRAKHRS